MTAQRIGKVASQFKTIHYKPLTEIRDRSIGLFREKFFRTELPAFFPSEVNAFSDLPAASKWFPASGNVNFQYLDRLAGDVLVPLEMYSQVDVGRQQEYGTFQRINAPFGVYLDWLRQKSQSDAEQHPTVSIYLAQANVADFPAKLQLDLPTPALVKAAGKGDVYNVNFWMGMPPTYTPLHRDGNPNIMVQMAGEKVVRLFEPQVGSQIFQQVKACLCGNTAGTEAIRGPEMMDGLERTIFEQIVWQNASSKLNPALEGYEAIISRGDAIFIPKGWWHSVKGVGGEVAASVNWWFR